MTLLKLMLFFKNFLFFVIKYFLYLQPELGYEKGRQQIHDSIGWIAVRTY